MENASRKQTILVVDDLETMRAFLCEFLEAAGYQVLSAPNGTEALDVAKKFRGVIDLLLTDLLMSGMHGFTLAELLLKERPRMRVLLISGEGPHGSFPTEQARNQLFLQKPFAADKLRAKVAEALS